MYSEPTKEEPEEPAIVPNLRPTTAPPRPALLTHWHSFYIEPSIRAVVPTTHIVKN